MKAPAALALVALLAASVFPIPALGADCPCINPNYLCFKDSKCWGGKKGQCSADYEECVLPTCTDTNCDSCPSGATKCSSCKAGYKVRLTGYCLYCCTPAHVRQCARVTVTACSRLCCTHSTHPTLRAPIHHRQPNERCFPHAPRPPPRNVHGRKPKPIRSLPSALSTRSAISAVAVSLLIPLPPLPPLPPFPFRSPHSALSAAVAVSLLPSLPR